MGLSGPLPKIIENSLKDFPEHCVFITMGDLTSPGNQEQQAGSLLRMPWRWDYMPAPMGLGATGN
jgi:hypothetical protein